MMIDNSNVIHKYLKNEAAQKEFIVLPKLYKGLK